MIKILMLISQRNFNEEEFLVVKKGLEEKKIQITVASISMDDVVGMDGMRIKPDKSLRETNPNEYEAFVIIGGSGSPKLLDYPEVIEWARRFDRENKLVAAICLAPMILAKAGILKGVMSTVFPADFAIGVLKRKGATYSNQHVIEDDNIITADGPDSTKEFVYKILKKFNL